MTGFEPQTSGIGSDRSTNWATATALIKCIYCKVLEFSQKFGLKRVIYQMSDRNVHIEQFIH